MADPRRTRKPNKANADATKRPVEASKGPPKVGRGEAETAGDDDAERALGRILSAGIPIVGVTAAVLVGRFVGLAPAILVLAGTALLGTIGFLWASLRTLTGEAPLPEGVQTHSLVSRSPAPERKRETLRALKDLEFEHSIGKIDDADYLLLQARYRETAKALMREIDTGLAPRRELAEKLAREYLAKKDLAPDEAPASEPVAAQAEPDADAPDVAPRLPCAKCGVSNEPDAAFCKKCGSPLTKPADATEEPSNATV